MQQLHPEGSGQMTRQGQAKEEQPRLANDLIASSEAWRNRELCGVARKPELQGKVRVSRVHNWAPARNPDKDPELTG